MPSQIGTFSRKRREVSRSRNKGPRLSPDHSPSAEPSPSTSRSQITSTDPRIDAGSLQESRRPTPPSVSLLLLPFEFRFSTVSFQCPPEGAIRPPKRSAQL